MMMPSSKREATEVAAEVVREWRCASARVFGRGGDHEVRVRGSVMGYTGTGTTTDVVEGEVGKRKEELEGPGKRRRWLDVRGIYH